MSTTYNFWVFLHIAGVLGFLAAHGAGWLAAVRLRRERNPERVHALLDLATAAGPLANGFLALLLLGGVVAGFQGSWWSQGWIGLAFLLVIAVTAFGSILLPRHLRSVRAALDGGQGGTALEGLLASRRPTLVAVVEIVVFAFVLYLMVYKPF